MNSHDNIHALVQQIECLIGKKQHAYIQGQGSRPHTIKPSSETFISLKEHTGIINYEPSELVIKARSGTPIKEIQQLLNDNNQQLGTDFPDYGNSTIGGAIATGETGTGRPFLGAIRDQVLGLGIINGKAQTLNFGGQVMKNVAGYDVSRLLCGSLGQLAVITDVTLKVVPLTQNKTVMIPFQENNLKVINQLAAQALPITAAVIDQGQVHLRLSGSEAVTRHAMQSMNAQISNVSENYWSLMSNKQHDFFQTDASIWQVRLSATKELKEYDQHSLIDWCGHQRYIKNDALGDILKTSDISAIAYKNLPNTETTSNLDESTKLIHLALKSAFDAHNIFNRL